MANLNPELAALPSLQRGGALLIDKPEGISSFGVIERLQRARIRATGIKKRDLPSLGHGGTLDPFATGLLVVGVGRGVKLCRYFLGSDKVYQAEIQFGQTSLSGDRTDPISEVSTTLPRNREEVQLAAQHFLSGPYLQIPPMHSAKKKDGKPLYELARQGIEVERQAQACRLNYFEIQNYQAPTGQFEVQCSSGTYIRVLAQDLARHLGTVAWLNSLRRIQSGKFSIAAALPLAEIESKTENGTPWENLSCWVPFDQLLLNSLPRLDATLEQALALIHGQKGSAAQLAQTLPQDPASRVAAIYFAEALMGVIRFEEGEWTIERVFITSGDAALSGRKSG